MNILIAIDSFKGCIDSLEAGESAAKGARMAFPDAEIIVRPLADGGEGTVQALASGCNGIMCKADVTGPLGKQVVCQYAIINGNTAVIEMAGAAGITLISENERNPLYTTTYGVGEVVKDAIVNGCRNFIIGIGGSATNDGGTGMLQALGFGMENSNGEAIAYGATGLKDLSVITDINVLSELNDCNFKVACDVTNPLCGENGCSMVFAPQKGASVKLAMQMDTWMYNYARVVQKFIPDADINYPGAGAAGGMGFAAKTFLDASLEPGVQLVLRETGFEQYVKEADIVVTGEGQLDGQTVMGKAPAGVASLAKQYNKPVIAFSGSVTDGAFVCNKTGIDAFFPVLRSVCTLKEAMDKENAIKNIMNTAEQVFRLIKTIK